ncbi:MAG: uroporphyrinogen-III C-methyltransferase [Gammaproteobacteria bacterium]|nr:uroporphyrinogen-III C-methyltransferase [Gammaproteobacteria bacterium]
MRHYPIFIDIQDHPCLVVGGGEVALKKIRLLRKAGARITVVAPKLSAAMRTEMDGKVQHVAREFNDQDIDGFRLITAATDNAAVNARVSELAQARNIPVNVVDQPELCSFITPAIVDRSPIVIALSTGGGAPVLARTLRARLEAWIPASFGLLAEAMRARRAELKKILPDESLRRRFWESVVDGPIAEYFYSGRARQGEQALDKLLAERNHSTEPQGGRGEVWLVGAGPGDPDLLTFRALRLMQQADVVLYDRLVSADVLELCRRDAERIYVGKRRAQHAVPQPELNQQLLELAQQGKRVLRLKGGDPFIFGRGGEEIELLAQAGIPFQVVPGITAASGCASYAGIPLTHRDHAQSCLFITGHLKNDTVNLDWQRLATANQTLVIYMGLVGLQTICRELIAHGMRADMPIALVERGTTQQQRVFCGTLDSFHSDIANQEVHAPTLIIIGSVVSLHPQLAWFKPRANTSG